jgi:hypothetical protein
MMSPLQPHNKPLVVTGRQRFAKLKRVLPEIQPAKPAKCLAASDDQGWLFELKHRIPFSGLPRKRAVPRTPPAGRNS